MTINPNTVGPYTRHAATVSISMSKVAHSFVSVLARIGGKSYSALKSLQIARMLSTLANMSDHQLAQIGIQRSDIPKYAETLLAEE